MDVSEEKLEEDLFIVGMWWRIGYGIFRIVLGLAILRIVGKPLVDVVNFLMARGLIDNPNNTLYVFVIQALSNHPLHITYFVSFYFIFWGVVDIILSYNLIKHRLWAFPLSLALIASFMVYEVVRFIHTGSLILVGLMCIDTFVFWLIWREYKKLTKSQTET